MPRDPLAGSGIALVWPFYGPHIALQTTLSTPLATPLPTVPGHLAGESQSC